MTTCVASYSNTVREVYEPFYPYECLRFSEISSVQLKHATCMALNQSRQSEGHHLPAFLVFVQAGNCFEALQITLTTPL